MTGLRRGNTLPRPAGRGGRALLAGALSAALLAGCGSYTKRDYVQRATGICDSTLRSLRLLSPPTLGSGSGAQLDSMAAYLERALALERSELNRLVGLRKPTQTAAQGRALARYLAALRDAVDELGALTAAARAGDKPMFDAAQATLARGSLPQLAADYGLRACSNAEASYT